MSATNRIIDIPRLKNMKCQGMHVELEYLWFAFFDKLLFITLFALEYVIFCRCFKGFAYWYQKNGERHIKTVSAATAMDCWDKLQSARHHEHLIWMSTLINEWSRWYFSSSRNDWVLSYPSNLGKSQTKPLFLPDSVERLKSQAMFMIMPLSESVNG